LRCRARYLTWLKHETGGGATAVRSAVPSARLIEVAPDLVGLTELPQGFSSRVSDAILDGLEQAARTLGGMPP